MLPLCGFTAAQLSQSLTVRYEPAAPETNTQWVVFSGASAATVPVTGDAGQRSQLSMKRKAKQRVFDSEAQANFIFRYYSDDLSYVLKPRLTEGNAMGNRSKNEFFKLCSRADVLKAAAEQEPRELAVVVIIRYPGGATVEKPIMRNWDQELKALGYQRIVFLRMSIKASQINGLEILEGP